MSPTTTAEPLDYFAGLAGTRRFTIEEYDRLIDAGILGPDDKVELLDGYILLKMDHVDPPPADGPFPEWRWLRRFSTGEYQRMIELGILRPEERLERLDGYLVCKMPQNNLHRAAVSRIHTRLLPRLSDGWFAFVHCPVSLGLADPEPDGIVVRGRETDYDARTPVATDFGIVIEVSDSSLVLDRRSKGQLYARHGIPVFWLVNLEDGRVEVYTDPDPAATPPAYQTRTDYRPGQDVPVVLDGAVVAHVPAADLLP